MNTGASNLATGIQPPQRGFAPDVSANTAHHVMGSRRNWQQVSGDVESGARTECRDRGEVNHCRCRIHVAQVKKHLPTSTPHLTGNRPRNNVAWCQLVALVIPRHEALTQTVPQIRALATHRFRNQKGWHVCQAQRRRVELVEFQIGEFSPGTVRQCHAIASCYRRISRIGVQLACATAGQNDVSATVELWCIVTLHRPNTSDPPLLHGNLGDERALDYLCVGCSQRRTKRRFDMEASCIAACVQNPPRRVGAFQPKRDLTPLAVEWHAIAEQVADARGRFLGQHLYCRQVAQPRARYQRVFQM